ncbi:MAG: TIGR01212 family radical SAM protein, partial [Bacteroidales bacterium]
MDRYKSFASYLKEKYGYRVQKISVNGGFTCPNRDGVKGTGGCIYCNNLTFSPDYANKILPIKQQIETGINYFSKKYPTQKYIAYFQNYSNTYAPVAVLRKKYFEALAYPDVVGIAISTRPDCLNDEIMQLLSEINQHYEVFLELGVESTDDKILTFLNRCHNFEDVIYATKLSQKYGIWTTLHLIFGLPYETKDDLKNKAEQISALGVQSLKLHQLQVIKNTELARLFVNNEIELQPLELEEYIDWVILFLEYLDPNIYIERFTAESPIELVLAPLWGKIKNYHVIEMIKSEMEKRNTFQGRLYKK